MNFTSILKEIEKTDPEVYERLSTRRRALKSFGSKVALAALPLAIGSLFKKAYGQTSSTSAVITALNFALEVEYFQYNFYTMANATGSVTTGTLIPSADAPGFTTIAAQEREHIIFLNGIITSLGGTPFTPPNYSATRLPDPYYIYPSPYDFTAGKVYNTFTDYNTFLTLAQVFEDTGLHTYNGQMSNLLGNSGVLTQAFQLQATEGRHAAHARLIRRNLGAAENPAPWITNNIPPELSGFPSNQFQPFYVGEDNIIQVNNVNITTLADSYSSTGTVPKISATAAFDEGMDSSTIASLLQPFMASGYTFTS